MYFQFYRKVYLGSETVDPENLFVNWRNLPPRLNGWNGVGMVDLNKYAPVLTSIGKLILDTNNQYFKKFHDSDRLRYVAQQLDHFLDENIDNKDIEISGRHFDRSDIREISRIFTKLADSQYFAELCY
jgi:hypothetical protein